MILRSLIKKAKKQSLVFLKTQEKLNTNSKIYKSCKYILRTTDFKIHYNSIYNILNNIHFFYDDINKHYAETDSINILINTFRQYNTKLLKDTLIHEALHYSILRNNKHFLSEKKEHDIMELIDKDLINYSPL